MTHAIIGNVAFALAAPTLVDVVFVVLFAEFLLHRSHVEISSPSGEEFAR